MRDARTLVRRKHRAQIGQSTDREQLPFTRAVVVDVGCYGPGEAGGIAREGRDFQGTTGNCPESHFQSRTYT